MENRPRIVIWDDEQQLIDHTEAALPSARYRVQSANKALQALHLIQTQAPDLVIFHFIAPPINGWNLFEAIEKACNHTALFFIADKARFEAAIQAVGGRAMDCLRAPFTPSELRFRVDNALAQQKLRRRHDRLEAGQRQLENQLHQSQKLEAIGTLAGGIAHDFNNVLSIILGNAELAMAGCDLTPDTKHHLERISAASLRAREMVQQLLRFSRKEKADRKPLCLNEVVCESLKLMRASLPANITIRQDIPDVPYTVIANATQVHQIMLNLCTNAAHAMTPDGGELTISIQSAPLSHNQARQAGLPPGDYVQLIVADTGPGIHKEVLRRIFDPYFTTKESGKGTGLGLAVVHRIIASSGGTIQAFSQPGESTQFHIYLPLAETLVDTPPEKTIHRHLPGGTENILIVDDEKMLVDILQQALEQLGYMVTAHTESQTALDTIAATPDAFDLLITDMTMPGLNGIDLAKAAQKLRPDLPTILCTGFNEQLGNLDPCKLGIEALILKPLGIRQLAETIRSVLLPQSMERRRKPRVSVSSGSVVISRTTPDQRFPLVDISPYGLAFHHAMPPTSQSAVEKLDIVTSDGQVAIRGLPCRVVSDLPAQHDALAGGTEQARRSVCFEQLSAQQAERIDRFIHTHATGLLH